ncbi:MAG: hydrogenase maturation nickel metallochaperone HypA [Verrucomicrobiota bacterium]|nr:hydrogenase maturation nickel metallochaperone HypA [Verrucomicrobiota bacterium]
MDSDGKSDIVESMHELGLMNHLLQDALAAARGGPVCGLSVRVGPLSGVVVEALQFAFEALSPGSPAAGATLTILETRPSFRCPDCQTRYETPLGAYQCPACGGTAGELCGGNELELVSIEVPDHV